MSTHDYDIANQLFPATRADINSLALAIASNNRGAGFPATTFGGMWCYNETDNKLYIRDKANAAWIALGTISGGNFTPFIAGAAIGQATTTVLGILTLATAAEATALTNATDALTPLTLASVLATNAALGLTRYATLTEIDTATAIDRAINVLEFGRTWKSGANIASAATLVEPADASKGASYFVTGNVGINALWAGETPGKIITLVFTGIPLLTNSANLILPAGINWQAAVGDVLTFRAETSPAWRCIQYQKANGKAVAETNPTVTTGLLLQRVVVNLTAFNEYSVSIPFDDTPPLIGEGQQLFSQAFTPENAGSTIVIKSSINLGPSGTNTQITLALFSGSTCLDAWPTFVQTTVGIATATREYVEAAGSVAARTYSIRGGSNAAAQWDVNGINNARLYGGVSKSVLIIEEWL